MDVFIDPRQRDWCIANEARAQEALRLLEVDYGASTMLGEAPPVRPAPYRRKPKLPDSHLLRFRMIVQHVCEAANLTEEEVKSPRRSGSVVVARAVVCYLAKRHTSWSLPRIGKALGGRDHATVIHAIRRVTLRWDEHRQLVEHVQEAMGL